MSIYIVHGIEKFHLLHQQKPFVQRNVNFVQELRLRVTSGKVLVLPWCTSYTSDFKIVLSTNVDLYGVIVLPFSS